MHVHSDGREIKASGIVVKSGESFNVSINYGSQALYSHAWKESATVDAEGKILDRHQTSIQDSKLMNNTVLLSDSFVHTLIDLIQSKKISNQNKIIFAVNSQNELKIDSVQDQDIKIKSFYITSSNPKPASRRQNPKLLALHQIKKHKENKPKHPRAKYADFSHMSEKVPVGHAVSLINGRTLAENILKKYGNINYASALRRYITEVLEVDKERELLYQSICVPAQEHISFTSNGARYIINKPEFFLNEVDALKQLQNKDGFSKIKLSIPNVKSSKDIQEIKDMLRKKGITRSHRFQLLVSIEVPSAVFTLDSILGEGVDGVICNPIRMSQYILGLDTHMFDKNKHIHDTAVQKALESIVKTAHKWSTPLIVHLPEHDMEIEKYIPNVRNIQIIYPAK